MKPAPLPNVDRLNELFTLDTKRGVLLHREKCGNKSDSRPENLRLATRSQNRHNVDTYANNSTNKKGTWYDKRRKAFFCAVQCNGLREQFGPFETLLEASNTYCIEAKERFGNFYRSESV